MCTCASGRFLSLAATAESVDCHVTLDHVCRPRRNVLLSRDLTAKLADVGFTRALRATHHSVEGPIG